MRLPAGYTARPVTDSDLEGVVALWRDADLAMVGEPEPIREYFTWIWHVIYVDPARDTHVVLAGDGSIAGFAQGTWDPGAGGPVDALGRVHPLHAGRGLGGHLVNWTEELGRKLGSQGVRQQILAVDESARGILRSRGYVRVRTSWTMGRPLGLDEETGDPPAGVAIRAFELGRDERGLFEVHEASFADHWDFRPGSYESFESEWYRADGWDPSLTFLAEADGVVVGHIVVLRFESGGYVGSLGVLAPARGRGVAQALLRRGFAELAARDTHDVTLSVDALNPTGAVALYEKVGMSMRRSFGVWDLGTDMEACGGG